MLVNDVIGALAQYDNIDTNMINNALQNLSTEHQTVIRCFRYGKHEVMEPITAFESKQESKHISMEL